MSALPDVWNGTKITLTCECGEIYMGGPRSGGCPDCKRKNRIAYMQRYHQTHQRKPRRIESEQDKYKIVHDPHETWWYGTELTRGEIAREMENGNIEPETMFKREDSTIVVKSSKTGLYIEEL